MGKYILSNDYKSLNIEDEKKGKETYRDFAQNQMVVAEEVNVEKIIGSGELVPSLLVDGKYVITKENAVEYSEAQKIASGTKFASSDKIKKIVDKFFELKDKSSAITKERSYLNGAVIGGVIGIIGGIVLKKNLFVTSIIGLASGGYIWYNIVAARKNGKTESSNLFLIK
jgi:tetrahydromethanopterin S-methyltransferase subunit G